jgi:hypothetical protein
MHPRASRPSVTAGRARRLRGVRCPGGRCPDGRSGPRGRGACPRGGRACPGGGGVGRRNGGGWAARRGRCRHRAGRVAGRIDDLHLRQIARGHRHRHRVALALRGIVERGVVHLLHGDQVSPGDRVDADALHVGDVPRVVVVTLGPDDHGAGRRRVVDGQPFEHGVLRPRVRGPVAEVGICQGAVVPQIRAHLQRPVRALAPGIGAVGPVEGAAAVRCDRPAGRVVVDGHRRRRAGTRGLDQRRRARGPRCVIRQSAGGGDQTGECQGDDPRQSGQQPAMRGRGVGEDGAEQSARVFGASPSQHERQERSWPFVWGPT